MSLAVEDRRQNFELALGLAARQVCESAVGFVIIDPAATEYTPIYPTTWSELESKGYVDRILNKRVFAMTGLGWLKGMHLLGEQDNPAFQRRVGLICAYLKNEVDGREAEAFVGLANLCSATGLSRGFVHYVIESDLIGVWHNVHGVIWHERGNLIRVPINFGLRKL